MEDLTVEEIQNRIRFLRERLVKKPVDSPSRKYYEWQLNRHQEALKARKVKV